MGIRIDSSAIEGRIAEVQERLQNMQPFFDVEAERARTLIDDAFDQQMSPEGEPWAPLKETSHAIGGLLRLNKSRARTYGPLTKRQAETRRNQRQVLAMRANGIEGPMTPANQRAYDKATKKRRDGMVRVDTGVDRRTIGVKAQKKGLLFGYGTDYGGYHETGTKNMERRGAMPFGRTGQQFVLAAKGAGKAFWDGFKERLAAWIVGSE